MSIWILALIFGGIAFLMTMTGRGGGNFYVLTLILAGFEMNLAASSGQFVLMCSSLMAAIIFSKHKISDWKLTLFLAVFIFISAFCGGFLGKHFNDKILKLIFAVLMFVAALLMLKKPKEKQKTKTKYTLILKSNEGEYFINLLITIPAVILTGFVSGMVGVSGGSFLVPLMLLSMNLPMHIAVAVSTTLVTVSASAGFFGHLGAGYFDLYQSLFLAGGGLTGAFFGAKFALKAKPSNLKYLFAGTQFLASVIIIINILYP